jgi:hypothetical protein
MLAVAAGMKPRNMTVLMKQITKRSSHIRILNRHLPNVLSCRRHLLFQSLFSRKHKKGLWTSRANEVCRLLVYRAVEEATPHKMRYVGNPSYGNYGVKRRV